MHFAWAGAPRKSAPFLIRGAGIHKRLAELSQLASIIIRMKRKVAVRVADYIAIGVLVASFVWVVADWIPRGKL